ncbi:MAG: bifunctional phosphopantothenoylcysteine decarboxylase/phosphopantothenate--cysteine ligase CoaBC [Lachnospiraceae bacterium]|nr:bifunctional phosphopantothenoylcysteine decarboxylase/phosphopantothenate--cysteine ligase CoaBC [Lachnospiraceae bacterium]
MLKGKTVVLGVTGSIAAYKIASLASMLVKAHADVHVIMTPNATNFIHPITFETLTNHKCLVDTFDRDFEFKVNHVNLAQSADIMMIAPASADVIAKLAHGIADDMLTTTALACKAPIYISPAMNTNMFTNPITQDNIATCEKYGMHVIAPATGYLACGDTGAGKMPEPETLYEYILKEIACEKDLNGKKILVTAGPTQEAIDPVRYITNHSTGKMGYAIARRAMLRGAEVTLVTGPVSIAPPPFVKVVPVISAQDMYDAVMQEAEKQDIIIKSAAVADYRPSHPAEEKVKKKEGDMAILLTRTWDILGTLGQRKIEVEQESSGGTDADRKPFPYLCGFSMETQDMVKNSREKLSKKHVDMIVANNLKQEGAGFGTDTNCVTLITSEETRELPLMSKEEVADALLNSILQYNQ